MRPNFNHVALGCCLLALAGVFAGAALPVRLEGPAPGSAGQLARTAFSVAASLSLLFGPGLAVRRWRPGSLSSLTYLPLPGLVLLELIGLLTWAAAGHVSAHLVSAAALGACLLGLSAAALWRREQPLLTPAELRALAIAAVVLLVVVGKALWSLGPVGELYGGTVSRTLEVGDRPDSRIPYHVAQLAAHGTSPYTGPGRANFLPWSFADRGPAAGVAAAPLMLLSGPAVPVGLPDEPWLPFDPEGFAAYRIAMMAMALTALLAVYGFAARVLASERAGLFACLLAALTPFVVHETYFTWPKLLAAALVVAAAQLLYERRPLRAGLMAGAGYVAHPLALLSVPSLGLFWAVLEWDRTWARRLARVAGGGLALAAGLGAWVAAWRLVSGPHYDQANFLHFFVIVDGRLPASFGDWLEGRVQSLLNTLVPLYLYLRFASDPSVNSIGGPSPRAVRFFFQYWNALPFGVGIAFFPLLLAYVWRAARRLPELVASVVPVPVLLFTVYWGASITGMLREGLHAEVLTLLLLFAWVQFAAAPVWAWSRGVRLLLLSRAPETLLMLALPTVYTNRALLGTGHRGTDLAALALMVGGLAWLGWQLWRLPEWEPALRRASAGEPTGRRAPGEARPASPEASP